MPHRNWFRRGPRQKRQAQALRGSLLQTRGLGLQPLEERCLLAVVTWVADTDGFWDVASNWQDDLGVNRVPSALDDVTIDRAADITVTVRSGTQSINSLNSSETLAITGGTLELTEASSVSTLTMSGGVLTGTGDFTIQVDMVWSGGTITGAGTTVLASSATGLITGNDIFTSAKDLGRHFENRGNLTFDGDFFNFGPTQTAVGVLTNRAGATLTIVGESDFEYRWANDDHLFVNEGTLRHVGAGTTTIELAITFNNNGLVEIEQGRLHLESLNGTHAGRFNVAAGAQLEFTGNFHVLQSESEVVGAGTVILNGTFGSVDANGLFRVSNLEVHGGGGTVRLTGAGDVTVLETFRWTGGRIAGTGTLFLSSTATGWITGNNISLNTKRLARTLENAGALTYDGDYLSFGSSETAGVLVNLPGAKLVAIGESDFRFGIFSALNQIRNHGLFQRLGAGETVINGISLHNTGLVDVQSGTLNVWGGGANSGSFQIGSSARLQILGAYSLEPNARFLGSGSLEFRDSGTVAAPQTLEIWHRDLGNSPFGFQQDFVLGSLVLTGASHVRLLDMSNDLIGGGAESMYVNTLSVGGSSAFDLNGLSFYTRQAQLDGSILGGAINPLPDGGPLTLNSPTPGRIAGIGEEDVWTLFGRAGQTVALQVGTGSAGNPPALQPSLEYASVQILDPDGNELAAGHNETPGQTIDLLGITLPLEGVYTIRVRAASAQSESTGHYNLTVWNASFDPFGLVLNQPLLGNLESRFNIDRWTFTASANQQVRFDLINAAAAGIRFQLNGPGGWMGFTDLQGDSDPITLPTTGDYVLEAYSRDAASGSYAFRMDTFNPIDLELGEVFSGDLVGAGHYQLFRIEVPTGNPLRVILDGANNADNIEVFVGIHRPPTRRDHLQRSIQSGADHTLQIPFAAPGTWYVFVHGQTVAAPTTFTLQLVSDSLFVASVAPTSHSVAEAVALTVRGAGFVPGTQVSLVADDGEVHPAGAVAVDAFDRVTANFDLIGIPAGLYDLRVTLPGSTSQTLPAAFEVLPAGQAQLETRLILPGALGRHATATLYVEYANVGSAAMPAPILILQSADPNGSDRPLLTLDQNRLAAGFWTSSVPDGFADSVQIYATGALPGVLLPGERLRVPVYYAGLQQPWDFSDHAAEFEILVHEAGNTSLIDWNSLQEELRPETIAATPWEGIFANLVDQIGPTWGDYVQRLSDNAAYLDRLGLRVIDIGQLFAFEVLQAVGLSPLPVVASAVDIALPAPGFPINFGRSFGNTITERHELGPFGYGWSASWELSLKLLDDGTVIVQGSADSQRRFQPDIRRAGAFSSSPGDNGTLRQVVNGYELKEANGILTRFHADGRLDYIQDANGNRITAGYAEGRLTSLNHSSGAFLTIAYNAAGRIASITDSAGETITYGYDAANDHLLTVTGPGGTVAYTYSSGTGSAREHALLSITDPGGVAQFFEYDARGRLSAVSLTGNAQRVEFAYGDAGQVTITDALGQTEKVFFDHRGLVARTEDAQGSYVRFVYNDLGQLIGYSDVLGRFRSFTWSNRGDFTGFTDELGNTTRFFTGGPNHRPLGFTDANGNTTRYAFDAVGNPNATTYPDGSVERAIYDATGNPTTLVNRRGQAIQLTYNAAGQVIQEDFPDGSTTAYGYDLQGRLVTATNAQGTTTFAYDPAGRMTRVDYPNSRWLEYVYDAAGRRVRMEDHSGSVVRYAYDSVGRLVELRDGADVLIIAYGYDAAGRLVREDKGNATYTIYTYDLLGRVASIVHHAPDDSINSFFEYSYDALGRVTGMVTSHGTWSYGYDLTGQLTKAAFVSANPDIPDQDLNYQYDALGNRVRTILNGVTTEYVANNLNQYVSAGDTIFQHDLDGNLVLEVSPTGTRSFTYNALNQLVRVETPEGVWEYEYDAFGNRIAKVVDGERTEYFREPGSFSRIIAVTSPSSFATFAHGLGRAGTRTSTGWSYFDSDILGSTAGISDGTGGYSQTYSYEPFGQNLLPSESTVVNSPGAFLGDAGAVPEEYGNYLMNARYYDPNHGRFVTADPIGISGNVNLYRYGAGDPINNTDSSGLTAISAALKALKWIKTIGSDARIAYKNGGAQKVKEIIKAVKESPHARQIGSKSKDAVESVAISPNFVFEPTAVLTASYWNEKTKTGIPWNDALGDFAAFGLDLFNPLALPNDIVEAVAFFPELLLPPSDTASQAATGAAGSIDPNSTVSVYVLMSTRLGANSLRDL